MILIEKKKEASGHIGGHFTGVGVVVFFFFFGRYHSG